MSDETRVRGVVRGPVYGVTRQGRRWGNTYRFTWSFSLLVFCATGGSAPVIPVELRGLAFDGHLVDGDWIQVEADWRDGAVLRPKAIRNLSTGVVVRGYGGSSAAAFFGVLLIFAIFAAAAWLLLHGGHP